MELFQPNECLILIVDDVPNNLRLLDEILDEMSYNTIFVNSGKQAVEIVENLTVQIDLILLDLMMPEMDGIEVCTIIKSNPSVIKIFLLFLSQQMKVRTVF